MEGLECPGWESERSCWACSPLGPALQTIARVQAHPLRLYVARSPPAARFLTLSCCSHVGHP